jgi:hypothetical protein
MEESKGRFWQIELINQFLHMLEEWIIMSLIVDSVEKSTSWSSGDQWSQWRSLKSCHVRTETREKIKPSMTRMIGFQYIGWGDKARARGNTYVTLFPLGSLPMKKSHFRSLFGVSYGVPVSSTVLEPDIPHSGRLGFVVTPPHSVAPLDRLWLSVSKWLRKKLS